MDAATNHEVTVRMWAIPEPPQTLDGLIGDLETQGVHIDTVDRVNGRLLVTQCTINPEGNVS